MPPLPSRMRRKDDRTGNGVLAYRCAQLLPLSLALEGIICQVLVPKADGKGRAVAMEILTATNATRSQIRANDLAMIGSTIMTSRQEGMQTLDNALKELVEKGVITFEAACAKAANPEQFAKANAALGKK